MEYTGWNPTSMPRAETQHAYLMSPLAGPGPAPQEAAAATPPEATREPVTVCVETVRADKKGDFDRLLQDVIRPAALRQARPGIRLLEPTAPQGDGSWTYVTLFDEALPNAEAGLQRLLEQAYGPQAAAEYEETYRQCRLGEALCYLTTQSVG
jgi:hypothetical protein